MNSTQSMDKKAHWETIYQTKELQNVSWYQPKPQTSIDLIEKWAKSKEDAIIDVGGGDSFLAEHLLGLGYNNITILDISEAAIERAKTRMGERANQVTWVVSNILDFKPTTKYAIWHDRAAFHFLNQVDEVEQYVENANNAIVENGSLIIGTFSVDGPLKCSGIDITQYSEISLEKTFANHFELQETFRVNHPTPFDTVQNFVFGTFKKLH